MTNYEIFKKLNDELGDEDFCEVFALLYRSMFDRGIPQIYDSHQMIKSMNVNELCSKLDQILSEIQTNVKVEDEDKLVKKEEVEVMTLEKLKNMNNNVVTINEAEEIEGDENVVGFESLGFSASHPDCKWYDVTLSDGTHIDLFLKE